ncbi:aldo/keto reductase [Paenibacillus roseipurpureus]|uniref:Aldo/keto reductase n=1 Tax=Paenibacillus roseopurpureus TaxID=2918901 RepID=A0AA96LQ65_9BACL|nr:aldo/keto reductase [Paenibacillus sp. MBLB1832]WNR45960.1 aldo/keto reductase [Paenibacillus sp. MBLB1832]
MRYRTFVKTGWQVSEIGFGTMQLGGCTGPTEDHESIRTLLTAWENGINFVDTASAYGDGRAEEVIGKALKKWTGAPIYIASK